VKIEVVFLTVFFAWWLKYVLISVYEFLPQFQVRTVNQEEVQAQLLFVFMQDEWVKS
jgi:hypothetical protein